MVVADARIGKCFVIAARRSGLLLDCRASRSPSRRALTFEDRAAAPVAFDVHLLDGGVVHEAVPGQRLLVSRRDVRSRIAIPAIDATNCAPAELLHAVKGQASDEGNCGSEADFTTSLGPCLLFPRMCCKTPIENWVEP